MDCLQEIHPFSCLQEIHPFWGWSAPLWRAIGWAKGGPAPYSLPAGSTEVGEIPEKQRCPQPLTRIRDGE